jgi:hypothetical protein
MFEGAGLYAGQRQSSRQALGGHAKPRDGEANGSWRSQRRTDRHCVRRDRLSRAPDREAASAAAPDEREAEEAAGDPHHGEQGAPVELEWNQGFVYYDFFSIPKGAPNRENAHKLLSWRLDPQRAAELTSNFPVALPSPVVFEAADPAISIYWANNPKNVSRAIEWSPDYWGAPSPAGNSTNEEYGQEKLNALLAQ